MTYEWAINIHIFLIFVALIFLMLIHVCINKTKSLLNLENTLREGRGRGRSYVTLEWLDGQKYVGELMDGERNGKGIFTWPDGSKYDGNWKNGKVEN